MDISRELLFFFSALGAFNGLLLGLFFVFFKKPKHISNFFLGGFLICLSIRIGKSVIFYFNPELAYGFLQFGLTACFFIGPFLYFYFKSLDKSDVDIQRLWKFNMLVLIPISLFINLKYPFESNLDLWRPHIINGIYLVWIAYSLLAIPSLLKILKRKDKVKSKIIWDVSIFIGNILIWGSFFFCGFTSYIAGALLFSFMFYLLILQIIFNKKTGNSVFGNNEKYKNKRIADQKATEIINKLDRILSEEQLYTNPNLKLSELASKMQIQSHVLSQILNDNVGKSFPHFLNQYRIEEAKSLITTNHNLTLEAIAYECGFNSKSTFYAAFKKHTGMTPSSYQKESKSAQ